MLLVSPLRPLIPKALRRHRDCFDSFSFDAFPFAS
jgi:hypothetical protein